LSFLRHAASWCRRFEVMLDSVGMARPTRKE
jgi:hypothetical protein